LGALEGGVLEPLKIYFEDFNSDKGLVSFFTEYKGKVEDRVWYRSEYLKEYEPGIMDAFLVAMILKAMKTKRPIHVCGELTESLVKNVKTFQKNTVNMRPWRYKEIEVNADSYVKDSKKKKGVLTTCTLGVDSLYTILTRKPDAAFYIGGCDIKLSEKYSLDSVKKISKLLLKDIDFIYIETNLRKVLGWGDHQLTYGAQVIAAAHILSKNFDKFIFPGNYATFTGPCGSSPDLDPFLGSNRFKVIHDTPIHRAVKIEALYNYWREGYNNIRPCWENTRKGMLAHENCGICTKCVRNLLICDCLGIPRPNSLYNNTNTEELLNTADRINDNEMHFLKEIMTYENCDPKVIRLIKEFIDAHETII
jgi:hypothetical protein